ncbi:hypothetical protein Pelo_11039 [Pelomyxa schiedti]|nr:hypothetical protein Pelo_11039 [Pelomyxa schiedti]
MDGGTLQHTNKHAHAVYVSHVVWAHVVPVWINAIKTAPDHGPLAAVERDHQTAVWLHLVGEALWPLAPLACRYSLTAAGAGGGLSFSNMYKRLYWAGLAGAPSCVRCLLRLLQADDPAPRSPRKVCAAVFRGLCGGGHTPLARALAGDARTEAPVPPRGVVAARHSRTPSLGRWSVAAMAEWWREDCGLVWPRDGDMASHLRECPLRSPLCAACRHGHLETARWLVRRLGVAEEWEVARPLAEALEEGHLDVVRWLSGEFLISSESLRRVGEPSDALQYSVEFSEWFVGRFPGAINGNMCLITDILSSKTVRGKSESEIIALCAWAKRTFFLTKVDGPQLSGSPTFLRWVAANFQVNLESSSTLYMAHPSLIQWALEEQRLPTSVELFLQMCGNRKGTLSVVKWIANKLPALSREQLRKALFRALECNNMQIAEWLEDSFHIMDEVKSDSETISCAVVEVCSHSFLGCIKGVEWFLQHVPLHLIPEAVIVESIQKSPFIQLSVYLLEMFHINAIKYDWTSVRERESRLSILVTSPAEVKRLISLLGKDIFSKELIAKLMTQGIIHSSKIMKWAICEYDLGSDQVKANSNELLFNRLKVGKNGMADWIIRSFGVTSQEMMTMVSRWASSSSAHSANLETWKLLLRHYPGLTADTVREHLLGMALSSPITAKFVMSKFPTITKAEMCKHVAQSPWFSSELPDETLIWLGIHPRDDDDWI